MSYIFQIIFIYYLFTTDWAANLAAVTVQWTGWSPANKQLGD